MDTSKLTFAVIGDGTLWAWYNTLIKNVLSTKDVRKVLELCSNEIDNLSRVPIQIGCSTKWRAKIGIGIHSVKDILSKGES